MYSKSTNEIYSVNVKQTSNAQNLPYLAMHMRQDRKNRSVNRNDSYLQPWHARCSEESLHTCFLVFIPFPALLCRAGSSSADGVLALSAVWIA
jgi:hypothetical protein